MRPAPTKNVPTREESASRSARIQRMHARGCCNRVIADELGLTREVVRTRLKRLGLAANSEDIL